MPSLAIDPRLPRWTEQPGHRAWLTAQAEALLAFFERHAIDPDGGFHVLDTAGRPVRTADGGRPPRQLHSTTRMVHCFAAAHLMGRPGADAIVDHGMDFLWNGHRDPVNGGYFWGIGANGPSDPLKQAYGHAFVLLAASSAKVAGHPDADRLLADVATILDERFWEDGPGASAEEFTPDWQSFDTYRGQNSNMHLTEALMAAHEATGDSLFLARAERIAELIIDRHARAAGWRVPEHFTADWQVDRAYAGSPMFRPAGTTPGHWLEWARLLVQLWQTGGRRHAWMPEAARALFDQAVTDAWDPAGGFWYSLEWDGTPRIRDRYWWPCCEAIGAAAFLGSLGDDPEIEAWYRRVWSFTATRLIDREHGGWHPQLDATLAPNSDPFFGKPDIYHAFQACMIPLLPKTGSLTRGLLATAKG
ncbi:AGE family epimerase/isomerase [Siculibacillus lacustris]|uniref:AGE family epimerase/isomerase n=1 Tax=Siculibacillus lacustris TaxID=1549641 RepID=A0A4Q9VKW8_9HYPH|nr:AGE family epimerase/isomerase [Siculibacillus lacustris]TBW35212.1 AGE family epimerase/isomerase [Siculibacillus lacustris]